MVGQLRIPELARTLFSREKQSRGIERIRRAGLTGITSVLAQGITILTGFVSIPLTLHYLGQERYGVWLTINSLLQWLFVSNMGLSGNALVNKLSEANGKDDRETARELVSTAFWSLAGMAITFTLFFAVCLPFINLPSVFNTTESVSISELKLSVIFAFICFIMMFPTSMVEAVYNSYQEGFIGNIWNITGSVFSLIALIVVTKMHGGLPLLVIALFGVRLFFSFLNAAYLFFFRHSWLYPSLKVVSKKSFFDLTTLGLTYFVAQLASMGATQSQPFMITQFMGPTFVPIFNIAQRILFLPALFIQMLVFPLMPAYGEAKARNDWKWISATLKHSTLLSIGISIPSLLVLSFLVKPIINRWLGPDLVPSNGLVAGLAVYAFIGIATTPISVMLYGLEKIRVQAVISVLNAIFFVILGIIFIQGGGLIGLTIGMIIAFTLTNVIGQVLQARVVLKRNSVSTND